MSQDRKSFRGQGKQTMIITVSAGADVEEIVAGRSHGLKQTINPFLLEE